MRDLRDVLPYFDAWIDWRRTVIGFFSCEFEPDLDRVIVSRVNRRSFWSWHSEERDANVWYEAELRKTGAVTWLFRSRFSSSPLSWVLQRIRYFANLGCSTQPVLLIPCYMQLLCTYIIILPPVFASSPASSQRSSSNPSSTMNAWSGWTDVRRRSRSSLSRILHSSLQLRRRPFDVLRILNSLGASGIVSTIFVFVLDPGGYGNCIIARFLFHAFR